MGPVRRAGAGARARASRWSGPATAALTAVLAVGGCAGPPRPAAHRVVISRFLYEPAHLRVAAGDTVVWVNQDLVPHSATAKSGAWDSKSISPDSSWRTVIAAKGVQPYGCVLHPTMKAELEVR